MVRKSFPRRSWVCLWLPVGFGGVLLPGSSRHQSREAVGCSALGNGEGLLWGWVPMSMSPWRGGCCQVHATGTDPPVMCLGWYGGVVRGEWRSHLRMSDVGCKRRKRKRPSGSFHQQLTAMTPVPIPSLCSSSPCIPPVLLTRSITSAASPNKTLQ